MSRFTADRFMNVAQELGGRCSSVQHLSPTVLYALAAPSTPDAIVEEVVERAAAGEKITSTIRCTVTSGGVTPWQDRRVRRPRDSGAGSRPF